ncbi:CobW family GTP-binding protein [Marinobacterium stanieri]|uniref:CobW family GTP-binding protein n=1 Tax=Marinobacterium stanieri TaxID=49186 RepID=UPI0002558F0A|nr:GTP-binding protein [Marinobacterium stanieri]
MTRQDTRVPVNVITGFLGAGKTTLLQQILQDEAFGDSAVLINEFGEVGLDNLLLGELEQDAVLLKSGCVCCTIRGELSEALKRLLSRREAGEIPYFKRIILETTGLAEPGPINSTLAAEPVLRNQLKPGTGICLVDAQNGVDSYRSYPVWVDQVAAADKVVISKSDLSTAEQLSQVEKIVHSVNPAAEILARKITSVELESLLKGISGGRQWKPVQIKNWLGSSVFTNPRPESQHLEGVSSFRLQLDGELDWTCLGIWLSLLLDQHGSNVLRVKGVLHPKDSAFPLVLHGVQHTVYPPELLPQWPTDDRDSYLIFITRHLSEVTIRRSLQVFLESISRFPAPRIRNG